MRPFLMGWGVSALLGDGALADEALAERMNVSVERLHRLLGCLDSRRVALDAPSDQQSTERFRRCAVSSDNPEERYVHCQRREIATSAVAMALCNLDARERFIAKRRMMAAATDELTLGQIASALGISRGRVRQLEERAKQKLGRSLAVHRDAF